MTMRTNYFLLLAILLGIIPMSYTHANDSIPKSVILYTPYTKISVSPGASIDYSIDLINGPVDECESFCQRIVRQLETRNEIRWLEP